MNCADVETLAPEVALGLVTGEERAEVLVHLDDCGACRALVDGLAATADEVLLVAPTASPPAGFAERTLARIGEEPIVLSPPRSRRRRITLLGAAAAALIAIAAAAFSLGSSGTAAADDVEVTMKAPSGKEVGEAYVHHGDTSWVLVEMKAWQEKTGGSNPGYVLRLGLDDGTTKDVQGGDLQSGSGAWGTAISFDASHVKSVALVGHDGRVWCSGIVT